MAKGRIPGPLSKKSLLGPINDGTSTLNPSPKPGPLRRHSAATRHEQMKIDDATRLREIRKLVEANNRSTLDTDLIICQIYMESRFDANAGARQDARGLMQMQKQAVQQVFKYRKQKELDHMPSDKETKAAFVEGASLHNSKKIFDEATNIQLGTEYMQYWIDTTSSIENAYKNYRGVSNGIYYQKISLFAAKLKRNPESMQLLIEMVQ